MPSTLEALLDLPEEHFIWGAYRAILGRDPDAQGLGNYLEKLRSGWLKLDILTELRDSPEGSLVRNRARTLSRELARTTAPAAAVSLATLMSHRGPRFVYCAYRTLLARDPTADEMAACLRELREKRSRMAIVMHLRQSPESQPRDSAESQNLFRELDLELRRSQWCRFPVIGPIVRRWYNVHSVTGDLSVHLGGQGDDRTWNADGTPEPAVEHRRDAPDLDSAPVVAGASPGRLAATLLCTLPGSENDRNDGQEGWQA